MFIIVNGLTRSRVHPKLKYIVYDSDDGVFEIISGADLLYSFQKLYETVEFYNLYGEGKNLTSSVHKLYMFMLDKISIIGDFKIYIDSSMMIIGDKNDRYICLKFKGRDFIINDFKIITNALAQESNHTDPFVLQFMDINTPDGSIKFDIIVNSIFNISLKYIKGNFFLRNKGDYMPIIARHNFSKAVLLEGGSNT